MTTVTIFFLGVIVSAITGLGALLIGLQEAADPEHSSVDELTEFEKQVVGRGDD